MGWNWGKAIGGAVAGGLSAGPWGLLAGIPAGFEKDAPNVDDVLPEIDPDAIAKKTIAGSGLAGTYSKMLGGSRSAARNYEGSLIASGVDPVTAARIAAEKEQSGVAAAQGQMLDTEREMTTSITSQLRPLQMQREEERQSYINQQKNQPNALETFGPAVLQAGLGNLAAGQGFLGKGFMKSTDVASVENFTDEMGVTTPKYLNKFGSQITDQGIINAYKNTAGKPSIWQTLTGGPVEITNTKAAPLGANERLMRGILDRATVNGNVEYKKVAEYMKEAGLGGGLTMDELTSAIQTMLPSIIESLKGLTPSVQPVN